VELQIPGCGTQGSDALHIVPSFPGVLDCMYASILWGAVPCHQGMEKFFGKHFMVLYCGSFSLSGLINIMQFNSSM
jgi:hypothetical protein